MRRFGIGAVVLFALLFSAVSPRRARADDKTIEEIGDWLQVVLPAGALAGTFVAKDKPGRIELLKSFGVTIGSVTMLKWSVDKVRPNSSNADSWPSGHTASAFSGASFLQTRYGSSWGVPALTLAAFTGYSRVQSDWHFFDDVISGASIALFSNWYFVTPLDRTAALMPSVTSTGYGLTIDLDRLLSGSTPKADEIKPFRPRWRYSWDFGPGWMDRNVVQAPPATGTPFDLSRFDNVSSPQTTSKIAIEAFLGDDRRHEILFQIAPFELRDFGAFAAPVSFGGQVFAPGVQTNSAWRLYEYRLRYRYAVVDAEPWHVKVGADVSLQDTSATLVQGATYAKVDDFVALPLLHASIGFDVAKDWRLILEGDYVYVSSDTHFEGSVLVRWQINPHWDANLGARYFERRIETSEMNNSYRQYFLYVGLGYSW